MLLSEEIKKYLPGRRQDGNNLSTLQRHAELNYLGHNSMANTLPKDVTNGHFY